MKNYAIGIDMGVKCTVTNDANAAAQGEMIYGAARGMKNFIVITLGTGGAVRVLSSTANCCTVMTVLPANSVTARLTTRATDVSVAADNEDVWRPTPPLQGSHEPPKR